MQTPRGTLPVARSVYPRLALGAAAVLIVDQVTKQLALDRLADRPHHVIDGILSLRLTYNSGGAFGILQGLPWLFLVGTIVVILGILFAARRVTDNTSVVGLALVLGGGLGNLADRVVRDTGGRVVDFVDLHVWPVFNVADASIVVGIIVLLLRGPKLAK